MCSDKLRHPNTFLVSLGEHVCPRTQAELRGQLVCFPLSSCKSWGCNSGHGPWRWTPVPTEHFGEPNLLIPDEINKQTNKTRAQRDKASNLTSQCQIMENSDWKSLRANLDAFYSASIGSSGHRRQLHPARPFMLLGFFQPHLAYSPVTLISKGIPLL